MAKYYNCTPFGRMVYNGADLTAGENGVILAIRISFQEKYVVFAFNGQCAVSPPAVKAKLEVRVTGLTTNFAHGVSAIAPYAGSNNTVARKLLHSLDFAVGGEAGRWHHLLWL